MVVEKVTSIVRRGKRVRTTSQGPARPAVRRLDAFVDEFLGEKLAVVLKSPVPWLAVGKYYDSSALCLCDQVLLPGLGIGSDLV